MNFQFRVIYHFSGGEETIITIHHQSGLIEKIQAIKEYKKQHGQ